MGGDALPPAGGRLSGGVRGAASGADALLRGGRGAGSAGLAARPARDRDGGSCSCAAPAFAGARSSTAHDSRWRTSERWASQQETEQKRSAVRGRLQVDTLHRHQVAP